MLRLALDADYFSESGGPAGAGAGAQGSSNAAGTHRPFGRNEEEDSKPSAQTLENKKQWEKQLPTLKRQWKPVLQSWALDLRTVPTSVAALSAKGLFGNVRGTVWLLAIGNSLRVNSNLYRTLLGRAADLQSILKEVAAQEEEEAAHAGAEEEQEEEEEELQQQQQGEDLEEGQDGGGYEEAEEEEEEEEKQRGGEELQGQADLSAQAETTATAAEAADGTLAADLQDRPSEAGDDALQEGMRSSSNADSAESSSHSEEQQTQQQEQEVPAADSTAPSSTDTHPAAVAGLSHGTSDAVIVGGSSLLSPPSQEAHLTPLEEVEEGGSNASVAGSDVFSTQAATERGGGAGSPVQRRKERVGSSSSLLSVSNTVTACYTEDGVLIRSIEPASPALKAMRRSDSHAGSPLTVEEDKEDSAAGVARGVGASKERTESSPDHRAKQQGGAKGRRSGSLGLLPAASMQALTEEDARTISTSSRTASVPAAFKTRYGGLTAAAGSSGSSGGQQAGSSPGGSAAGESVSRARPSRTALARASSVGNLDTAPFSRGGGINGAWTVHGPMATTSSIIARAASASGLRLQSRGADVEAVSDAGAAAASPLGSSEQLDAFAVAFPSKSGGDGSGGRSTAMKGQDLQQIKEQQQQQQQQQHTFEHVGGSIMRADVSGFITMGAGVPAASTGGSAGAAGGGAAGSSSSAGPGSLLASAAKERDASFTGSSLPVSRSGLSKDRGSKPHLQPDMAKGGLEREGEEVAGASAVTAALSTSSSLLSRRSGEAQPAGEKPESVSNLHRGASAGGNSALSAAAEAAGPPSSRQRASEAAGKSARPSKGAAAVRGKAGAAAGAAAALGPANTSRLAAGRSTSSAVSAAAASLYMRSFHGQEASLAIVDQDLSRTFPEFAFFYEGSPFREQLHRILSAYTLMRPDCGYVQGMSHIAAILLLTVGTISPAPAGFSGAAAGGGSCHSSSSSSSAAAGGAGGSNSASIPVKREAIASNPEQIETQKLDRALTTSQEAEATSGSLQQSSSDSSISNSSSISSAAHPVDVGAAAVATSVTLTSANSSSEGIAAGNEALLHHSLQKDALGQEERTAEEEGDVTISSLQQMMGGSAAATPSQADKRSSKKQQEVGREGESSEGEEDDEDEEEEEVGEAAGPSAAAQLAFSPSSTHPGRERSHRFSRFSNYSFLEHSRSPSPSNGGEGVTRKGRGNRRGSGLGASPVEEELDAVIEAVAATVGLPGLSAPSTPLPAKRLSETASRNNREGLTTNTVQKSTQNTAPTTPAASALAPAAPELGSSSSSKRSSWSLFGLFGSGNNGSSSSSKDGGGTGAGGRAAEEGHAESTGTPAAERKQQQQQKDFQGASSAMSIAGASIQAGSSSRIADIATVRGYSSFSASIGSSSASALHQGSSGGSWGGNSSKQAGGAAGSAESQDTSSAALQQVHSSSFSFSPSVNTRGFSSRKLGRQSGSKHSEGSSSDGPSLSTGPASASAAHPAPLQGLPPASPAATAARSLSRGREKQLQEQKKAASLSPSPKPATAFSPTPSPSSSSTSRPSHQQQQQQPLTRQASYKQEREEPVVFVPSSARNDGSWGSPGFKSAASIAGQTGKGFSSAFAAGRGEAMTPVGGKGLGGERSGGKVLGGGAAAAGTPSGSTVTLAKHSSSGAASGSAAASASTSILSPAASLSKKALDASRKEAAELEEALQGLRSAAFGRFGRNPATFPSSSSSAFSGHSGGRGSSLFTTELDESEALVFAAFANLLSRSPLRWLAVRDTERIALYYEVFETALARCLPKLKAVFEEQSIKPSLYLTSWLLSLFSKPLGLECSIRLWDRILTSGPEEILRCCLGLLKHSEERILKLHLAGSQEGGEDSFEPIMRLLQRLPLSLRDEFAISSKVDSVKLLQSEVLQLRIMEEVEF